MFQIILLTVAVQVASQVSESTDETTIMSKPKITRSPAHTVLYSADNVTLKCEVTDAPSGVEYDWYKDSTQLGSHTDKLTITEPGDGSYQCKAKVGIFQSDKSDPHTLTVQTIPTAKTTLVSKWAEVYQSEKVNLKCEIQGRSEAWIYKWYRNGVSLQESNSQLEIQSATMDNSGNYTCQGFLQNRLNTEHSNALTLKVNERPVPQVRSDWTEAFPGETVSLQCVIQGVSENWIYMWFRDMEKIGSSDHENRAGNNLSLSVNPSHDGAYKCQAELQGRSVKTHISPQFQLKVYGAQPTVLLNQDPTFPLIYTQEQVKLICSIQEQTSNWEYLWYKVPDEVNSIFSDAIYTISSATLSHNGIYTCHVRRRGKQYPSTKSHNLTIGEPPQPNLSIESQWKTFYGNEKVTLKCSINGISNEWSYEWFRNGTNVSKDKDISLFGTILSISSAKTSHSGWYTCRGKHAKRLPVTTREAEALRLQIYDKTPNPKTGKHPSFEFFYTEEQVQHDCNMPGDGWEYHWYEGSKPTEPLSTDPTYNISSASFSHTFYCTAKRGDFSVRSENIEVIVKARPPAVLTLETEWGDIMAGNILTLKCEITDEREWNYTWYENGLKLNGSLDIYKVTATEETIKSEFKCKGIRTERPLYSAMSEGFIVNNTVFKRKILLAISGCLICCIVILIIGCVILKFTRKSAKKETYRITEDLFFSMADSNQTAAPLKEYMDNKPTDSEMKECDEKELLSDCISAVHVDGVIKDEDSPSTEANGLTSFKGT